MALIKCSECGKEISDKAKQCLYCGCPIEKKVFCVECGNILSENDTSCPNCGCPTIRQTNSISNGNSINNNNETKTNSMAVGGFITAMVSLLLNFWGIVGIVATILSGIGLNQIINDKYSEKGKGLAIAGLCIGGFSILYGLIQILILSNLL